MKGPDRSNVEIKEKRMLVNRGEVLVLQKAERDILTICSQQTPLVYKALTDSVPVELWPFIPKENRLESVDNPVMGHYSEKRSTLKSISSVEKKNEVESENKDYMDVHELDDDVDPLVGNPFSVLKDEVDEQEELEVSCIENNNVPEMTEDQYKVQKAGFENRKKNYELLLADVTEDEEANTIKLKIIEIGVWQKELRAKRMAYLDEETNVSMASSSITSNSSIVKSLKNIVLKDSSTPLKSGTPLQSSLGTPVKIEKNSAQVSSTSRQYHNDPRYLVEHDAHWCILEPSNEYEKRVLSQRMSIAADYAKEALKFQGILFSFLTENYENYLLRQTEFVLALRRSDVIYI